MFRLYLLASVLFFLGSCINNKKSTNKKIESSKFFFLLESNRDTLFYKIVYENYKNKDKEGLERHKYVGIVRRNNIELAAVLKRSLIKNDTVIDEKFYQCDLVDNKRIQSCNITDLSFQLFFELPPDGLNKNDEWSFNSPFKFDNLREEDYQTSAKGKIKNIIRLDSTSFDIHLEYLINAKRDVSSSDYPQKFGSTNIRFRDERTVILSGVFAIRPSSRHWKSFNLYQRVEHSEPNKSLKEEKANFILEE